MVLRATASSENIRFDRPASCGWWHVDGGLGELHGVEVVAQGDALVQGREGAESEQTQSYERGAIPSASALTGYRGGFRPRPAAPRRSRGPAAPAGPPAVHRRLTGRWCA